MISASSGGSSRCQYTIGSGMAGCVMPTILNGRVIVTFCPSRWTLGSRPVLTIVFEPRDNRRRMDRRGATGRYSNGTQEVRLKSLRHVATVLFIGLFGVVLLAAQKVFVNLHPEEHLKALFPGAVAFSPK